MAIRRVEILLDEPTPRVVVESEMEPVSAAEIVLAFLASVDPNELDRLTMQLDYSERPIFNCLEVLKRMASGDGRT